MSKLIIAGVLSALLLATTPVLAAPKVNFGEDSGEYTKDGECDDPRFSGVGMTSTPLLADDILADASDCRTAYKAGKLTLLGVSDDGVVSFGDDNGEYANDGECDDPRFVGAGMTTTALLADDILHDATDCKTAFDAGKLQLR